MLLSFVVPVYNESGSIADVIERISRVVPDRADFEIIFVDNCSTDDTRQLITKAAEIDSRIKLVGLSRNFGPSVETSLLAGLYASSGDACVVLYGDLQDPPEVVQEFVDAWLLGYDVVYGVQTARDGEAWWRRTGAHWFYRVMASGSDSPLPAHAGDFRLLSRLVVDDLLKMPERARYMRGLSSWLGYRQLGVPYQRAARSSGTSKAHLGAVIRTAFTGITSFSLKPLRILTAAGFLLSAICLLLIAGLVLMWAFGTPVPGLTSVLVAILFSGAVNLLALGLIGEYLGRIQLEVKRRPHFVIREAINLPDVNPGAVQLDAY